MSVGVVVAVGVAVDVGVEMSVGVSVGVLVGVVVVVDVAVDVGVSVLVGVCVGVSVGVAVAVAVDVVKSGDLAIPSEQSWIHWDSRRAASTWVGSRERNIVTSISFTIACFILITAPLRATL